MCFIPAFSVSPRLPLSCCAPSPHPSSSRDISLPPSTITTKGTPPPCILNTTILHNIPSLPPHLPSPPSHPFDNDGHILAISFQSSSQPWSRIRFVRTKPFLRESKLQQRLYPGLFGTPISSWNGPLKPKAAANEGVFLWGNLTKRRVFAWGLRSLPIGIDIANLVSKGPSALGSVLTDAPQLATQRGTEIVAAPVEMDGTLFVPAIGRAQNGSVLGLFVVAVDGMYKVIKRFPKVKMPGGCVVVDFAVTKNFCVLMMHKIKTKGVLGALLGGKDKDKSPKVDVGFGSIIVIIPKDGTSYGSCVLSGEVFTGFAGVEEGDDGKIFVDVLGLTFASSRTSEVKASMVREIQSGCVGKELMDAEVDRVGMKRVCIPINRTSQGIESNLQGSVEDIKGISSDVSLLSIGVQPSDIEEKETQIVFTSFDSQAGRWGVCVVDAGTKEVLGKWSDNEGYMLGRPLFLQDENEYVSVWATPGKDCQYETAQLKIFNTNSVNEGPVYSIEFDQEQFGYLGSSVGGVWKRESVDWEKERDKPARSAYEIFDSRRWNDIDSGFSSLGLNQ